jgi:hypothetical protein
MSTRRAFLREALAGAGIFASARAASGRGMESTRDAREKNGGREKLSGGRRCAVPVETPDVPGLPMKWTEPLPRPTREGHDRNPRQGASSFASKPNRIVVFVKHRRPYAFTTHVMYWLRPAITPPSTSQMAPVTQEDLPDSRVTTICATSSGRPIRPMGWKLLKL